jgi:hypothetical protein
MNEITQHYFYLLETILNAIILTIFILIVVLFL